MVGPLIISCRGLSHAGLPGRHPSPPFLRPNAPARRGGWRRVVAQGCKLCVLHGGARAHLRQATHAACPHACVVLGALAGVLGKVALEDGLPVGDAEVRAPPERAVLGRLLDPLACPRGIQQLMHLQASKDFYEALCWQQRGEQGLAVVVE